MSQYQYDAYRYSSVRISYTRRIRYQTITDIVPACQCSTLSTTIFEKLRWFGLAYRDGYARPNSINSILYSGILMIVPTEYSVGLLMALWIRVVSVYYDTTPPVKRSTEKK